MLLLPAVFIFVLTGLPALFPEFGRQFSTRVVAGTPEQEPGVAAAWEAQVERIKAADHGLYLEDQRQIPFRRLIRTKAFWVARALDVIVAVTTMYLVAYAYGKVGCPFRRWPLCLLVEHNNQAASSQGKREEGSAEDELAKNEGDSPLRERLAAERHLRGVAPTEEKADSSFCQETDFASMHAGWQAAVHTEPNRATPLSLANDKSFSSSPALRAEGGN
ncbi:hypothetical protein Efla_005174 [Eimeria flavescens]